MLSGYNSPQALSVIKTTVEKIRTQHNSDLIYVMDPVLGDNGVMYCANGIFHLLTRSECIQIYRDMFSIASLITPNQFEASWLTDTIVSDHASATSALDILHKLGASAVVITSCDSVEEPDILTLYASVKGEKFSITFPKINDRQFTGTGDLFASLLLARWDGKTKDSLAEACEKGLAAMNGVLKRTNEKANKTKGGNCRDCELRIIESRDVIESPEALYKSVMF